MPARPSRHRPAGRVERDRRALELEHPPAPRPRMPRRAGAQDGRAAFAAACGLPREHHRPRRRDRSTQLDRGNRPGRDGQARHRRRGAPATSGGADARIQIAAIDPGQHARPARIQRDRERTAGQRPPGERDRRREHAPVAAFGDAKTPGVHPRDDRIAALVRRRDRRAAVLIEHRDRAEHAVGKAVRVEDAHAQDGARVAGTARRRPRRRRAALRGHRFGAHEHGAPAAVQLELLDRRERRFGRLAPAAAGRAHSPPSNGRGGCIAYGLPAHTSSPSPAAPNDTATGLRTPAGASVSERHAALA